MIDFDLPIRTKRSQTRLYVKSRDRLGGTNFVRLDTRRESHWTSGNLYTVGGRPVDDSCPWGPIENFEDSPFEEIIDVAEVREREKEAAERDRFNADVQEQMGDNELFGLF